MKTQKITDVETIINLFHKVNNILILPHIIPDGDTIGSSIALYLVLKEMGKSPCILVSEDVPYNIKFLLHKDILCKSIDKDFSLDLVVSVDCSDVERLGDRGSYIDKAKYSLNIDHHVTNSYFADYNFVDPKAAATGEIMYFIINALGDFLTKDIATCLYTAISTDTGSFKYDNTTSKTHKIASELLEKNIDLNLINTEIYQNKPVYKVKLLTEVLKTLEFYCENKVAVLYITKDMIERNSAKPEDSEGFIEYARDIEGVDVGIFLKEMNKGQIRVGFRAKYDVDVSKIAKAFGGGGHKKASGCTIYDSMENAKKMIIDIIKNHL